MIDSLFIDNIDIDLHSHKNWKLNIKQKRLKINR